MTEKSGAAKALYLIFLAPAHFFLPLLRQMVFGIIPHGRPSKKWTYRQAILVRVVKSFLRISAVMRPRLPHSLHKGSEGDRYTLVVPFDNDYYAGPLADPEVRQGSLGGTWTPKLATRARTVEPSAISVALHFHGGAYVIGDGRDADAGFVADVLHKDAGFTHVFCPQYRLANTAKERFPAQLQDAVTSYLYLTQKVGVPPQRVFLSGDSAGGNLALALLRYIHEYGEELGIPAPGGALLWSPWTDVSAASGDLSAISSAPRYVTDYLHETFAEWGSNHLTDYGKISVTDPYISPGASEGYESSVPMWVHTGGSELLYDDNEKFVKTFRGAGSQVEWYVDEHCPHDIILMGRMLGWEKETRQAGRKAGEFARRVSA